MDERRHGDRRQRLISLRFPDRRRGFQRRQPQSTVARHYQSALLSLREAPTAVVLLAALLFALNLADLVLTQYALGAGAIEINPVMAALFESGSAAAVKLAVGAFAVAGLWSMRRYRPALSMLVVMVAAMGILVTYQTVLITLVL